MIIYGGRRLYQYNKDDFRFKFRFNTWKQREAVHYKSFSLIRKRLINN